MSASAAEAVDVGQRHGDVNVVVPGDKAAVAHGPEQGAAVEPVRDVVAPADGVNFAQYVQLFQLAAAQVALHVGPQGFVVFHERLRFTSITWPV